ncbi:hypothetical protein FA15DRAFT_704540 [Coprinopsis marcescibilis]|uniref:Uncharacterized protein n=1 Tax=Coprinopsis marcescibilis TaxID=230819 RepID=A0A5C3KVS5_COPMA|nr:hypothetical protein FA15DRAFT_704540 [Coprinopsis marcescibilis]
MSGYSDWSMGPLTSFPRLICRPAEGLRLTDSQSIKTTGVSLFLEEESLLSRGVVNPAHVVKVHRRHLEGARSTVRLKVGEHQLKRAPKSVQIPANLKLEQTHAKLNLEEERYPSRGVVSPSHVEEVRQQDPEVARSTSRLKIEPNYPKRVPKRAHSLGNLRLEQLEGESNPSRGVVKLWEVKSVQDPNDARVSGPLRQAKGHRNSGVDRSPNLPSRNPRQDLRLLNSI